MKDRTIWALIAFLSALAFADSVWLHALASDIEAFGSACRVVEGFDCAPALRSHWGEFYYLALPSWGMGVFMLLLLFALQAILRESERDRNALLCLVISGAGVVFVARLAYISIARLSDYCLFCLVVHVLTFLIFLASLVAFRRRRSPVLETVRKEIGSVLADKRILALAVFGVLFAFFGIPYSARLARENMLASHPYERSVLEGAAPRRSLADRIADLPFRGDPNAAVTVVEFGDFTCSVCRDAYYLTEEYIGLGIKYVFIPFPRSPECNPMSEKFREGACDAALALVYARRKGSFWTVHDAVFEDPGLLAVGRADELARIAGADSMNTIRADHEALEALRRDLDLAQHLGVHRTPTLYVNGMLLEAMPPHWYMEDLILRELERAKR